MQLSSLCKISICPKLIVTHILLPQGWMHQQRYPSSLVPPSITALIFCPPLSVSFCLMPSLLGYQHTLKSGYLPVSCALSLILSFASVFLTTSLSLGRLSAVSVSPSVSPPFPHSLSLSLSFAHIHTHALLLSQDKNVCAIKVCIYIAIKKQ